MPYVKAYISPESLQRSGYGPTVIKYSTARSGLLKLARKALITWSRSKPISIMLLIADCNASPDKKLAPWPDPAAAAASLAASA
jgi:hypothetical protein